MESREHPWLHTNVPAEWERGRRNTAAAIAAVIALTGSVAKYAAGAPATLGRSSGCFGVLSGIRASARLMAIRSGVSRPPAREADGNDDVGGSARG